MLSSFPVSFLNLGQHAVESVGKLPQVVIGCLGGANRKVVVNRNRFRRAGQTRDGCGDDRLEFGGKYECQQQRHQKNDRDHDREFTDLGIDVLQVRFQINGADELALQQDGLKYAQPVVFKQSAIAVRWKGRTVFASSGARLRPGRAGNWPEFGRRRSTARHWRWSVWLLRPESSSSAALRSPKLSAAVLLSPMISASTLRSRRSESRCM